MCATLLIILGGTLISQPDASGDPTAAGNLLPRPDPRQVEQVIGISRPAPVPLTPEFTRTPPPQIERRVAAIGLWPEGFQLARRQGRLVRHENGWALTFSEPQSDHRLIRLLPNSKLRQMEAYTSEGTRSVDFSISGLVTEYHDQNYLLLRDVVILSRRDPPEVPGNSGPDPVTRPGSGKLLERLHQSATFGKPLTSSALPGHAPEPAMPRRSVAPVDEISRLLPEDSSLINRVGRLIPDASGPLLAFDSGGDGPADPPLRLLPNLALQQMEAYAAGGSRSVVFVVSGEITAYRGRNYLLVRRFFIRPDDGNLR